MIPAQQFALPLIDPLEPRILPQDGRVWFTLNRITDDGRMVQKSHQLALIETVLRALGRASDTYISQGTFSLPRRRAVHLAWMTHAYTDLDTYHKDCWSGLAPDDMLNEIQWFCANNDIPPPSAILSSGRGYYCKWFWSKPIPRAEAGRAVAVNRALAGRLVRFCADPSAVDVSRILRVAGTINGKNRGRVCILWLNGPPGEPTTYEFDSFARGILPAAAYMDLDVPGHDEQEETRWPAAGQGCGHHRFNREQWHWGVLEDLRMLAAVRHPGGIVQAGSRDLFGHLAACQLARVIPARSLFHEIVAITRTFLPADYVDADEFRGHCSSLLRRAREAADGELVTFGNRRRTPIYTYSKQRLIDLLQITPDEELKMTRLVSDAEKRHRAVERRRAAGMVERAEYEASAAQRRPIIAEMRMRGMTWRAISAGLGISVGEAHRLGSGQ